MALILQAAYGAVDLLVVGRFGTTSGLSAVSTGSNVLNLATFVVTQLSMGTTILIARFIGEKRQEDIGPLVGGSCVVFVVISAVLFVVMVGFARPISILMQAPEEAVELTSAYVRICGAALATVFAQLISVIFALFLLAKRASKKELPFEISKGDFKINSQCRRALKIGFPLALQECLTQISFLALCAFVNRLGLEASSGYGVASKIVSFVMLIPSALMQSIASFVSQNVGAGNETRAKKSMLTGVRIGIGIGCVVFLFVLLKGDLLTGIFTADEGVMKKGYDYLKGFAADAILTGILFSMIGYFNGYDKTLWVMVQGLVQILLVRLPLAYVMSIQPNASLTYIGLAAPASSLVGIILNVGFYIWMNRKKVAEHKQKHYERKET